MTISGFRDNFWVIHKLLCNFCRKYGYFGSFFTHIGWDLGQNLNFNDIKDSLNGLDHISRGIVVNE